MKTNRKFKNQQSPYLNQSTMESESIGTICAFLVVVVLTLVFSTIC